MHGWCSAVDSMSLGSVLGCGLGVLVHVAVGIITFKL